MFNFNYRNPECDWKKIQNSTFQAVGLTIDPLNDHIQCVYGLNCRICSGNLCLFDAKSIEH